MLQRPLLLCLALVAGAAMAQSGVPAAAPTQGPPQPRMERLVVEDTATVIDEIRVGGQTQAVVVQPKGTLPAYEFQPADLARSRPADHRDGLSAGAARVWNLFKF